MKLLTRIICILLISCLLISAIGCENEVKAYEMDSVSLYTAYAPNYTDCPCQGDSSFPAITANYFVDSYATKESIPKLYSECDAEKQRQIFWFDSG